MVKKALSLFLTFVLGCGCFSLLGEAVSSSKITSSLTFAELTEEQLEVVNSGGKISSVYTSQLSTKARTNKSVRLPEEFNLSSDNEISAGNQGKLATCWAFSALISSETGLKQKNIDTNLSESHLAWFSYSSENQQKAFAHIFSDYDPFMNGGFDYTATGSLANWFGPADEESYPYSSSAISEDARFDCVAHLQNVISFPEYEYEDEAQQKLAAKALVNQVKNEMYKTRQAVDISFLSANMKQCFNSETNAWYNPTGNRTDHAVTVIGWDDNFPKENFNNSDSIEDDGAWLVVNSWGSGWGDDGLFWLSYEDVTIDYDGIYLYESNTNYENIYSYDESIQYSPIGFDDSTEIYMSNVFCAEKDEVLEAVSFYTTDVETQYTVKIYTELEDGENPSSGKLMSEFSGIKALPGYYTEELTEGIDLKGGEKFSVVVYLNNPTQVLTAQVEAIYMDYRIQSSEDVGNAGESFVSQDGEGWVDIYGKAIKGFDGNAYMRLGNFAIKAFTSEDKYVKFSVDSGEIPFTEKLELQCLSADEIYYTLDGSDPRTDGILYTEPISVLCASTVKAAAKRDGTFGKVYSRKYSQAGATLTSLIFSSAYSKIEADVTQTELGDILVDNSCREVEITAVSHYSISLNGTPIQSGETVKLPVEEYKENKLVITVSGNGYTDKTYTASVFVNPLGFDYENETVFFDEEKVTVQTKYYQPVKSGQSVTRWLDASYTMTFSVDFDEKSLLVNLPERNSLPEPEIDYKNERSVQKYGSRVYYKFSQDESFDENRYIENDYIPAFAGKTVYLYRKSGNGKFSSKTVEWVIPERPTLPDVQVEKVKKTKSELTYYESLTYSCLDESVKISEGTFENLTPGESYLFEVFIPATDKSFSSEILSFEITTNTDKNFERLKEIIGEKSSDNSFAENLRLFFAKIIYNIRIFIAKIFE